MKKIKNILLIALMGSSALSYGISKEALVGVFTGCWIGTCAGSAALSKTCSRLADNRPEHKERLQTASNFLKGVACVSAVPVASVLAAMVAFNLFGSKKMGRIVGFPARLVIIDPAAIISEK